jgi:hypothetical protein
MRRVRDLAAGSVLPLLVAVCAVAFVAPALRTIKLDVPRALQVD